MTLYYVPLESYIERYTCQWSAPVVGWLERRWLEAGVDYVRVDGALAFQAPRPITTGCVLDAVKRSRFCFSQIDVLLGLAEAGALRSSDVIYFDDFWTPGFEALPYAFHLMGLRPRMYAFLHAQSVDEFDFTHSMRSWMRPMERGIATVLDGIFVCCHTLKDLVVQGGVCEAAKVHVTGHPFAADEVLGRMPEWYRGGLVSGVIQPRKDQVVWSSRWDAEKNPLFFLKVVREVVRRRPHAKFLICTSSPQIRSNCPLAMRGLAAALAELPHNLEVRQGLSKEEYYATLCESKVQVNTARQDFVAITLLEASVAGCYPVYPYFRSFPETLRRDCRYMYWPEDVEAAASLLVRVLDQEGLWTADSIRERSWIHSRFETAWRRQLQYMGVVEGTADDPFDK